MSENLVIVESPAKGKTIEKYLGKGFTVLASYGHVRDLIPKEGAVDPNQRYAMRYELIDRNQKHVEAIIRALKGSYTLSSHRPWSWGRGDFVAFIWDSQRTRAIRRQTSTARGVSWNY